MLNRPFWFAVTATLLPLLGVVHGAFMIEKLDRAVVVVPATKGVLISWRLLGTDSSSVSFNVYRGSTKLTSSPLTSVTSYLDTAGSSSYNYTVRSVLNGVENSANTAKYFTNGYFPIPITAPSGGKTPSGESYTYEANDGSIGDVDGDGQFEIILKWMPTNAKDNSQSGYTGPAYFDCYTLAGKRLWRINLGKNIRSGAHYNPFVVYDLDSDGKAEFMVKTADGTVDGVGTVIGSSTADYRTSYGYVLSGPEYLTVFNGLTGKAMATTNYLPARGTVSSWGDSYGNRVDRFLAGVAYIDGAKPTAIFSRGYYTRAVIVAWNYRSGSLTRVWTSDSATSGAGLYGQGAHWFSVADANGDGKHDIIYGSGTLSGAGTVLYRTGLGHGDALHVGELNPNHSGLEVFMVHEDTSSKYGMEMHDAKTGTILWGIYTGTDNGRGVCADVDSSNAGDECWSSSVGYLCSAKGTSLTSVKPSLLNFAVYWDGDLMREILDRTMVNKYNAATHTESRLLTAYNYASATSNSGTKATPVLSADFLGDWREEIIFRNSDNTKLLIFSTNIETTYRFPTLLHDPTYRCQVAGQNMGYNQPPHTSYWIGSGKATLPSLTHP